MPLSDRHRRKDLSAGGFFGRSLSVFGAALPQFFVLGLLILAPLSVIDYQDFKNPVPEGEVDLQRQLIASLAQLVLGNVLAGILVFGVFQRLAGESVDLGACVSQALRRLPLILGVAMAYGLLVGVGFLCLVVPGIWLAVLLALVLPVAVVEGGFGNAFRRSAELTSGYRWSILGALVLGYMIVFAISFVGGIAIVSLASSGPLVLALVLLPIKVLGGLFLAILPTVIYHDLRSEKDGVGVEELRRVFS
jgi:hypothetical protein